jgi:hypothetical protein
MEEDAQEMQSEDVSPMQDGEWHALDLAAAQEAANLRILREAFAARSKFNDALVQQVGR